MPEWNLKRLAHFLAVADAPSLSQAARRLGVSQPALSSSIQKLEEELGAELFDREGAMSLTPVGTAFLPRARAALVQVEELKREFSLLKGGALGELRLGCGPTVADTVVGQAVGHLIERLPGLSVQLVVREYHALAPMLREREVELVVVDLEGLEESPEFSTIPLPQQEIQIFCGAGHPLAAKAGVSVRELFAFPLAAAALPAWAEAWLRAHGGGEVPRLSVECSHHALLKGVVENSAALSGAPLAIIQPELEAGRLAVIDLKAPPLMLKSGVVHLRHATLSEGAAALLTELRRPDPFGGAEARRPSPGPLRRDRVEV